MRAKPADALPVNCVVSLTVIVHYTFQHCITHKQTRQGNLVAWRYTNGILETTNCNFCNFITFERAPLTECIQPVVYLVFPISHCISQTTSFYTNVTKNMIFSFYTPFLVKISTRQMFPIIFTMNIFLWVVHNLPK